MRPRSLLALLLVVLAFAPAAAAADLNGSRARQSEATLLTVLAGRDDVTAWPFSQALTAAVAVAALPDATPGDRATAAQLIAHLRGYDSRLGYTSQRYGELYYDHFARDGAMDATQWSYNQGNVIGALLALGDATSLAHAERIAAASLRWLEPQRNGDEPPEFVAVLARNVVALGAVDGDPRWRAAVQTYADATWSRPLPRVLDRAAVTQLYALLAATTGR